MSQNSDIGLTFNFMTKNGKIFHTFFMNIFLDFIKLKLRPKYKNLGHISLHMNIFYKCMKFYDWEMNIQRDILVQELKVKNSIFHFMTPSLCYFFEMFI